MASIYRTYTLSACNGQRINSESGEFEDFTDVLVGDYTPPRASRALRRKYKDETITINNIEKETAKYKMDALDFMAHATRIE